jgi:thiosulfate dehydrogenase (quinone) large subunit
MKTDIRTIEYSGRQIFALTFLRVLIGWHFLYEGLAKLFSNPAWSSKSYLEGSVGPLAPAFKAMTLNAKILGAIDLLNIWGLILIGLSLFTGLFSRPAKILGIILLLLYYFAYPPLPGFLANAPVEGNYWIVNKTFIEIAALFVLYLFPSGNISGLDRYIKNKS